MKNNFRKCKEMKALSERITKAFSGKIFVLPKRRKISVALRYGDLVGILMFALEKIGKENSASLLSASQQKRRSVRVAKISERPFCGQRRRADSFSFVQCRAQCCWSCYWKRRERRDSAQNLHWVSTVCCMHAGNRTFRRNT